jgi:hypothetical protein
LDNSLSPHKKIKNTIIKGNSIEHIEEMNPELNDSLKKKFIGGGNFIIEKVPSH